jgi:uncharacterized protein (TIGR03067 family)
MKSQSVRAALALGVLAAAFLALGRPWPAGADDKPDPKDDAKLLTAKWKVWRIENSNGIVADGTDALVIDGAQMKYLNGGSAPGTEGKLSIDPSKDPKELDFEITARGNIGEKRLGIYRVSKGQLEICWGDSKKRPTKFTGRPAPGAGVEYITYHSDDFKPDEAAAKETKRLEGKWVSEKGGDGVVIDGDDMQFLYGGNNKGAKAKFVVDPSKDPKEIEVVYTVGSERYKTRIGIYKTEDDKLTISLSDFDSDKRPTKLAGGDAPGAGKWFQVYKREKDK